MSYNRQFENEIRDLTTKRTHWLTNTLFSKKIGRPPKLDKKSLAKSIERLQKLATDGLAKSFAKKEFDRCVPKEKKWRIKGHGVDQKRNNFQNWLEEHFSGQKNYVYVFWGHRNNCLYVGRTGTSNQRPVNHFNKYWFTMATRIQIFTTSTYKDLPKLECLGQHYFIPSYNKMKSATKKWTSSCPLCDIHKSIDSELKSIFWK